MIGGAPPLLTKLTLAGGVALAEATGDEEAAGALAHRTNVWATNWTA